MAWYDRLGRFIRNIFGGGAPEPEEPPTEEPPTDYGFPEPPAEPEQLDFGFPEEAEPSIWDDKWERWIDEKGYPENWQDVDVTLENPFGFPITNSIEDWHDIVTNTGKEELLATYGLDNLQIIRQLENEGLWDAADWETWREAYGETH